MWGIALLMITLAVLGCSPETRYNTLSFFFDGVPAPGDHGDQTTLGRRKSLRAKEGSPEYKSHGPYAAKLCDACHVQGGGQLIMPVEELCLNCHNLNIRKKYIHGPVASGGCRVCHNPHGSGKPFLLVDEPRTFCFYCHDPVEIGSREVHKDSVGTQCTECHNPHASDNDFLLN
ncbi:MAG TPA: cytochrome c3 family protein [Nitrospirota bacterium]|nr:cytochrome c3 family protein [Nitrospirota bacterium]